MNEFLNKNRMLVWTIVIVVAIVFVTIGYIEFQKGEIETTATESVQ